MDRATTAKTRAELDRLVRDLPEDAGAAGTAVAERGPDKPSWHISPIGGFSVSGPWRMARQVIVVSLIGGAQLDLSQAQLAAKEVTLTKVSLVGGVTVNVPPAIRVNASGFSLIGGTSVNAGPEPGPGAPTVHIRAFSLVGGTRIYRRGPAGQSQPAGQPGPPGSHGWTGGPSGGPSGTSGGPSGGPNGDRGATARPAAPGTDASPGGGRQRGWRPPVTCGP